MSAKCIHRSKLAYLHGNDAEPAVSHAVLDKVLAAYPPAFPPPPIMYLQPGNPPTH
jgi:hypothetical protein